MIRKKPSVTAGERVPMRQFITLALTLAIPIALQNLLTSCASLIDTAMVVALGNTATSAIGVAGRFPFFLNLACFGLCSGSATMISQYWGARDRDGIHRTFGMLLTFSMGIALLISACLFFIPDKLMRIFIDDPAVIELGAQYLKIFSIAAFLTVFNQLAGAALRATEQVALPLISSVFSVVVNTFMNYCLIEGHFGFPALHLRGAAIATVLGLAVQALILLFYILFSNNVLRAPSLRAYFAWTAAFGKHYTRIVTPAFLNEVAWSVGTNIYIMVLARQGNDYYSGYTVFETVQQLFFVFFAGICHACSIIVGKTVGEGRHALAKVYAKRFLVMTPLMGIFFGILVILTRYPILGLLEIETELALQTAAQCLLVYALWLGCRMIPYTGICGIFRAGGDTITGCIYELCCMYFFSIPAVVLLGTFTDIPFVLLVLCMYVCEDLPKGILCIIHFFRGRWIKQITKTPAPPVDETAEISSTM
ncbi:MAG: MATE family efflux transporter [Clostridia bacterium]|nr:MATE family efflux transporter [Clostridia bacterium]